MPRLEAKGEAPADRQSRPVRVWDLPTRLFHWLLVVLVAASFVTANLGITWMPYHMWSGYGILGLLLFRIIWGFVGGKYARFSDFAAGPAVVWRYAKSMLRRDAPRHLGHNPLGGWSVLAMLTALLVQTVTGLFANDDIFTEGPLYPWVSKATSDWLTRVHKVNQEILLVLVAVHVAAVIYYLLFKRDNLMLPMITGRKPWRGKAEGAENRLWLALVIAAAAAAAVYTLVG